MIVITLCIPGNKEGGLLLKTPGEKLGERQLQMPTASFYMSGKVVERQPKSKSANKHIMRIRATNNVFPPFSLWEIWE